MANASDIFADESCTLTANDMPIVAGFVGIHAKFAWKLDDNQTCTNGEDEHAEDSESRYFQLRVSRLAQELRRWPVPSLYRGRPRALSRQIDNMRLCIPSEPVAVGHLC